MAKSFATTMEKQDEMVGFPDALLDAFGNIRRQGTEAI